MSLAASTGTFCLPSTTLLPPASSLVLATLLLYFPDKTGPVEILLLLTVTPKLMLLSVSSYLQQQLMSPCDDDTTLLLQDCYLLEERERLQEEWRLFREQKKNFEKERRSFTEAAIRLGLEVLEKWTGIRKGNSYGRWVAIKYFCHSTHWSAPIQQYLSANISRQRSFPYCVKHIFGHCRRSFCWHLKFFFFIDWKIQLLHLKWPYF